MDGDEDSRVSGGSSASFSFSSRSSLISSETRRAPLTASESDGSFIRRHGLACLYILVGTLIIAAAITYFLADYDVGAAGELLIEGGNRIADGLASLGVLAGVVNVLRGLCLIPKKIAEWKEANPKKAAVLSLIYGLLLLLVAAVLFYFSGGFSTPLSYSMAAKSFLLLASALNSVLDIVKGVRGMYQNNMFSLGKSGIGGQNVSGLVRPQTL